MWGDEADVLVVGFGAAGGAAALSAHDAGAQVLLVEKGTQGGGNSRYSGGTIREYLDAEQAVAYLQAITYGTVEEGMVRAFVEEGCRVPQWVQELGGELTLSPRGSTYSPSGTARIYPPAPHVLFPHLPGSDGIGGRYVVKGEGSAGGIRLWGLLHKNVVARGIPVLYSTAARRLLTSSDGEVIGLVAESAGKQVQLRARRGVVLACGGFENHPDMQKNYLGLVYPPLGHVGNTGDGVRMAQELGADLWHMNGVACTLGYCVPDYDAPLGFGMPAPGYIFVDQYCHRFMDETGTDTHQMGFIFSQFDTTSGTYPRMPAYVLFDEATRQAGPVGHTVQGRISDYYQWSPRNTAEIERGWIKTGKTVSELAEALALEPKALQETVARYNLACLGGHDADFNRRQDTLTPLIAPPFYGAAIWPCLINTEGGPRRNARAQVVSVRGEPIRRLYSAGELGSIWGMINPGAGNISECLAFGRIAGRNAAAEEPWE